MTITPIVAAEIGVLVTQSKTSLWRSRLVTVLSNPHVKKILNILAILLLLGCIVAFIDALTYSPPVQQKLDQHIEIPVEVPQVDIKTLLSEEEREALVQKISTMEEPTRLDNYGNDCFINSCLQYIMHSPKLCDFLLNHNNLNDSNSENFYRLFLLFCRQYSQGKVSFSTKAFRQALSGFSNNRQECTSEAIECLLSLYDTSSIAQLLIRTRIARLNGFTVYDNRNNEPKDPIPLVHLNFPEGMNNKPTIKSLWKHTFKTESACGKIYVNPDENEAIEVDSDELYTTVKLERELLQLCLVRHRNDLTKIDTEVDFTGYLPLNFGNKQFYDLVGFTLHDGSFHGGHYVAYVKRQKQWFYISDSYYEKVDEEKALEAARRGYTFSFEEVVRPRSDSSSSDSSVGEVYSSDGSTIPFDMLSEDEDDSQIWTSSDEDV